MDMANAFEKLKRDFAKHRVKTIVLGVLAVVMAVFVVKAFNEMRPRTVAAASPLLIAESITDGTGVSAEDAAARIKQSRDLWKILRESRGMDAESAFKFDPTYFALDPKSVIQHETDRVQPVAKTGPQVSENTEQMERDARVSGIREEARGLIVRSTVVGSGNSKPVAVINDRILGVGDRILGFEITAIQAREVEFKKEGITLAVKMAEDSSAQ
jgi:hypothetical protein